MITKISKKNKKNKKNKKITQNGSGDVNGGKIVYNSTKPNPKPEPIANNSLYSRVVRPKVQSNVIFENTHQTLRVARREAGMNRSIIRKTPSRIGFKGRGGKKGGSRVNQKRVTKRSTYRRVNNKRRTHKRK